jgi:hypothetical protein
MENYVARLKEDTEKHQQSIKKMLKPSDLAAALESQVPVEKDDILIVQCRTPAARRWVHIWAHQQKLQSKACKYEEFYDNRMYYCKQCRNWKYHDNMGWKDDWGFCTDAYFGQYVKCLWCGDDNPNIFHSDDTEEDWKYDWKVKETHNAVVIGFDLPEKHGNFIFGHFKKKKDHPEDAEIPKEQVLQALDGLCNWRVVKTTWSEAQESIHGIRK